MLPFKLFRSMPLLCVVRNRITVKKDQLARTVGSFKKPLSVTLTRDHIQTLKSNLFVNKTALSNDDWNSVREQLIQNYKHITENNIDAVVLSVCNDADHLPLAKNYIAYLQHIGKEPNAATLGRLLRIYNAAYHKSQRLSEDEQNEVLEIFGILRKKHDVFDATTCENLIYGLVATKYWEECRDLLQMTKLTSTPSLNAYTELAEKAFNMGNMPLGWELLHDMVNNNKQPKCSIYHAYLNEIYKDSHTFIYNLEKLFRFLEANELIITREVCENIENLCKLQPLNLSVNPSGLTKTGKCTNCSKQMQRISTSAEEFELLSNAFLERVLIRNDVFQKSTPEEIERFKEFVAATAPYDCVIDGLNVAYSSGIKKSTAHLANLLASVVRYFANKKKKVLVLGRKHMTKWPKDSMRYINKNSSVFLTNDMSQDDPFMLYATLKSGQKTDFFSRDLMRSHAFLLGSELKRIFRHWQQEHQYSLITQTEGGNVLVKEPVRHLICTHKVYNTWHVPYKDEYEVNASDTFEVPKNWLCIKIRK